MEAKLKHLEMIQAIISRMAGNSFLLKGWSVTLVAALFALAVKDANVRYVYLAYFPCIVFWILDGYFLWQERLFRNLYNKVRMLTETDIDFSMDTSEFKKIRSWQDSIFSITLRIFHGTVIGAIILVMLIMIIC